MRREWRYLSLGLVLLIAVCCIAQDDDDDDSIPQENDGDNPASLSLNFDRQGAARITLNLAATAIDSDTLPNIVAETFHCPAGTLKHPDKFPLDPSLQKNLSAARRERFAKQMEEYNRHLLTGHCNAALSRTGLLFSADFDYAALIGELKRIGVDQLSITVDVPKTQFLDYSRTDLLSNASQSSTYLVYVIPLKELPQHATLHLAYGLRPRDVQRALVVLAGFLVAPILVTLWMRRRALALARTDPAAAWFGFIRGLNWLMLGSMLVWMSSGFGARKTLEEWIFQQGSSLPFMAAADVALMLVPFFLIYLVCVSLSYAVHAQLRRTQWTRREFFAQQLATVGAQALPLMLGVSGITVLHQQPELGAGLLIAAVAAFQLLTILKLRLMKAFPQPLTAGDLRDRIFGLAGRLGVTVNQIFILPAGKGQVANAFAARNRIVMFTDYLLEHLNKKEVDGVAAHELAHLRYKHPAKMGFALIAALFLPQYFSWLSRTVMSLSMSAFSFISVASDARVRANLIFHMWRGLNKFEQWPQRDLVLLIAGMTCFYLLSRHFENVADATAVRLTGDAEAQITGILKVSRLNLIPIRWGKATESWLTHPSAVQRVHRMAAAGGLPHGRLQEILRQYEAEGSAAKVVPAEDRYTVPPAADPENMRAALNERTRTQWKLWTLLSAYVLPPALFSLAIVKLQLSGWNSFAAYVAGIVATVVLITLAGVWLGETGHDREKTLATQRFGSGKVAPGLNGDIFVGFAPGPHPRFFGLYYHWDSGFLVLSRNKFQFVGRQVKFAFSPSEIVGIAIGRGGPSWWKYERVYIQWKTENGQNGIFNLYSLEPGSVWSNRSRVRRLYEEVLKWRQQTEGYPPARPELTDLKTLELGQVTSIAPPQLGGLRANLRILAYLLPLAVVVSMLTHASSGYVLFSVLISRVIQSIPYWRYRDQVPAFSRGVPGTPEAKGTSAGA